jgi:Holliday junction DNA helicase RuvA
MIARLAGRVEALEDGRCVIDVNGVGYLVHASTRTLAALPAGGTAALLIETQVREDAILLYGFAEPAEREWFRLLTTVQGVGAKVALGVLSALSPRELIAAIHAGDRAALTRAPGVGAKLAMRLLSELRERAGAMPAGTGFAPVLPPPGGDAAADALSALVNLGYRRPEAQAALARVTERLGQGAALDALIRDSLKELAR